MKIQTFLVLLLIAAIVIAEVNAGKQQKGGKNSKKGNKNEKGKGKEQKGKYDKNAKEELKQEEAAVQEGENGQDGVQAEEQKSNKKVKKEKKVKVEEPANQEGEEKPQKASKKSKRSAESEPEAACNCPAGPQGPPGPPGECVYQPVCPEAESQCESQVFVTKPSGVIALHSQSTAVPECPLGQEKLYEGYSLLQIDASGQSISMNLGELESCARIFTLGLTSSCGIDGQCSDAQRNDRSYWLLANGSLGVEPLLEVDATELVSRCVVCDVAGPVLALHSQSNEVTKCPSGWDTLWSGYSYVSSTFDHGANSQQLASPGSCLREARRPLSLECNPQKGSCNVFEGQSDSWLKSNAADGSPSRCAVCVKVA